MKTTDITFEITFKVSCPETFLAAARASAAEDNASYIFEDADRDDDQDERLRIAAVQLLDPGCLAGCDVYGSSAEVL